MSERERAKKFMELFFKEVPDIATIAYMGVALEGEALIRIKFDGDKLDYQYEKDDCER